MQTRRESRRPDIRTSVLERDDYTCQRCGDSYDQPHQLRAVLKTPLAEGGEDNIANRETRCTRCANLGNIPSNSDGSNQHTQLIQQLKAKDKASRIQSFAEDARELEKIPSILIAAVALGVNAEAVTNISIFNNRFVWFGFGCWLIALFTFEMAYYTARTSSASPTAVDAVVGDDTADSGDEVTEETVASYRRNALLIAIGKFSLALSVVGLSTGALATFDLL